MKAVSVTRENAGLRVVAYPGETKILLAMSLADDQVNQTNKNLAGFAIWRRYDGQTEAVLSNRIGFGAGVSNETTAKDRKWTASDRAPFQKVRWIDVPPEGFVAPISYRVKALYFAGNGTAMVDGPEVTVDLTPATQFNTAFLPAFTRGYIASQAYADKFANADVRPKGPKTPDFDTKPFRLVYEWLGAGARKRLFEFIADCVSDKYAQVSVFAYDLDGREDPIRPHKSAQVSHGQMESGSARPAHCDMSCSLHSIVVVGQLTAPTCVPRSSLMN